MGITSKDGGKNIMKKEIIGIFVCMLVIISLFSNVYAIEIGKMDDGWDIKQVDQMQSSSPISKWLKA